MNALIIGGTRNLGPSIARALVDAGYHLTVFNRGLTPGELPGAAERVQGDRTREEDLARLAGRDFDLVVDTALYDGGAAALTTRLLRGRVGRYVFISTGQVYLVREGLERPYREEDYDGPVMAEPADDPEQDGWKYGVWKRDAEDELARAHGEEGFPFVSLRLPMVNSELDHYHRIPKYIARLRDEGPIVLPEGEHPMLRHVYGEDVVQAVLAVAAGRGALGRAYNVSQEDSLALDGFLALLAGFCGGRARTVTVPRERMELLGLLPDSSPFSDRWMSMLDGTRSREELGMRYTTYPEYLPRLVEHFDAAGAPPPPGYERRKVELDLATAIEAERAAQAPEV